MPEEQQLRPGIEGVELSKVLLPGAVSSRAWRQNPQESTDVLLEHWALSHTPVAQIRQIEALAERVLGDQTAARVWLLRPNLATDDKPPLDLLGDPAGFQRVENLLLRIEYGVLA